MPAFHEEIVRRIEAGEEPLTFESHLADCQPCRRELAARLPRGDAREVPATLVEQVKRLAEPGSRGRNLIRWGWSAAAAALIVFATFAVRERSRTDSPAGEVLRSPTAPPAVALLSPADGVSLPIGPATFRWAAVPTARRYTLRLLDVRGSIISERSTASDSVALDLPSEAGSAYWYVTAHLEDGRLVESTARSFKLVPPSPR